MSSDEQEKATSFDFSKLESLRLLCRQIQRDQVPSLKYFKSGVGFIHVRKEKEKKEGDISVSSSATCVLSLVATGEWKANKADTTSLARQLLAENQSAGLDIDNPFTLAWILDAVTALEQDVPESFAGDDEDKSKIGHKEKKLQEAVELGKGAVSIATYPGSPYLTQLVVRVLRRRKKLLPELETMVNDWAWGELTRQLALVQAKSKTRDAFAFAYLLNACHIRHPHLRAQPRTKQHSARIAPNGIRLPTQGWDLAAKQTPFSLPQSWKCALL